MVPREWYPVSRTARQMRSPISSRCPGRRASEGASSMIFWCRRWSVHSRSPRHTALPCWSATIWNSMCRGASM